jgi:hypothetical protein
MLQLLEHMDDWLLLRTGSAREGIFDGPTALLMSLGLCFSLPNLYTVGKTPCMGDQPVSRPLLQHRATRTKNELELGSNPRPKFSSARRQFIALDREATVIGP